jgi:hypothetical protein
MHISGIMRVVAAEATMRAMVPLLSFISLRMLRTFLLSHLRALGQNLHSSVCFPLLQNLHGNGHRTMSIAHHRNLKYTVQVTVIQRASNAGFVLRVRVNAHDISSLLLNPHQELTRT